jgi:hypothetical protein
MSGAGSIIRNRQQVIKGSSEAFSLLQNIKNEIGASSAEGLAGCFRISDNCLAHFMYLDAIRKYIELNGRSRGSYIITNDEDLKVPDKLSADVNFELCSYDREVEANILEITWKNSTISINVAKVREIPVQDLWFERIWKDYLEDNFIEG